MTQSESNGIYIYYAEDFNGNVKSLSIKEYSITDFIIGPLKGNGKKGYAVVPKSEWEKEKINCSNIKNYK